MDIFLSKRHVEDLDMSKGAMAAYVALRSIYNNFCREIVYVSDRSLCFELYGNASWKRTIQEMVSKGLKELIELKMVNLVEKKGTDYILDVSPLYIKNVKEAKSDEEKDYYVLITDEELHKIFNLPSSVDKASLLRYFLVMLGSINFNATYDDIRNGPLSNFVGYMPESYLAKITGITDTTAVAFTKLLEDQELIYVYRHVARYLEEEQRFRRLNNNYGRFKDKEYIEKYAGNIDEINGGMTERLAGHNKKRSLKQKYNCMCNGKEYSLEDAKEIYDYIHTKNCEIQELIIKTTDEEQIDRYTDQILSEEVFKKYDFYAENPWDDIDWSDNVSEKVASGNAITSEIDEATDDSIDASTEKEGVWGAALSDCHSAGELIDDEELEYYESDDGWCYVIDPKLGKMSNEEKTKKVS